jgi:hydrogenase nickel incorporation protein HypA/HybF
MHESSLARRILSLSLAAAERSGGGRIRRVRGRIAETEALSPASIQLHFTACAHDTPAADAALVLSLVHVEARCRACAEVYVPEHHVLLCPRCGSTDGEELGETGLWLESVELEGPA